MSLTHYETKIKHNNQSLFLIAPKQEPLKGLLVCRQLVKKCIKSFDNHSMVFIFIKLFSCLLLSRSGSSTLVTEWDKINAKFYYKSSLREK